MAKERKKNCWEIMRCGREMSGHNKDIGICPAAMTKELHKTHGGTHAGRACWIVAGTMCGGKPQGVFAQKFKKCERCPFYQLVKKEEGPRFQLSVLLMEKINPTMSASRQTVQSE